MKLIKVVLSILANICYVLIGVYFLISLPTFIGYTPLVVLSGSMSPTLEVGTIIYYEKVDSSEIKKMDIITFASGSDSNVTHRVVDFVDDKIQTKGDANLSPDTELVSYEEVKGRLIDFKIPYLGYYVKFVNEHLYLIVFVVIILILEFFVGNMKSFNIDRKNKERSVVDEK